MPRPRSGNLRENSVTAASSNRSRMAARWAHMENGIVSQSAKTYRDTVDSRSGQNVQPFPDEFGTSGGAGRLHSQSITSLSGSLAGTGPNGTRTFLRGWFGLDEPSFSGFKIGSEHGEKDVSGDILAMSPPTEMGRRDLPASNIPHHRVPNNEEDVWETTSAHDTHL
uniref:Uncharacterized protein n=2 Tax=Phakopsora pachyrhizi TaxID=170000 RepID=A0A0S1MJX9_PHAPC